MKKVAFRILVFGLPVVLLGVCETVLPLNLFTTRPHEALLYKHKGAGMPYYPNHRIEMNSLGDLCTYTSNSLIKEDLWITDEIGYRNNIYINRPDVLLIGNSFLLGVGLPQDSTLTNLLAAKSVNGLKFYNLAHANINDFIVLMKNEVIHKPEILVLCLSEREQPPKIDLSDSRKISKTTPLLVWIDKATRLYSVNYLMSRVLNTKIKGIRSEVDKNMFFLDGKNIRNELFHPEEIAQILDSYKTFCDSLGIKFILVPTPNKETVYHEHVPIYKQPDYLVHLDSALFKRNITAVNTLDVLNGYRRNHPELIYYLDDTHWNSRGANLIADEIIRVIHELQ